MVLHRRHPDRPGRREHKRRQGAAGPPWWRRWPGWVCQPGGRAPVRAVWTNRAAERVRSGLSLVADNVTDVAARWSSEQVLGLAPDGASQRTAERLASGPALSGTGSAGGLVWGLCAGSGGRPAQGVAALSGPSGPAYRCSCPSRKFPCKHALALLLSWSRGAVPEAGTEGAPDFAREWQPGRAARPARPKPKTPRDPEGAARRGPPRGGRG